MSRIQNPQGGIQNTDCQILLHGVILILQLQE